MLDLSIDSFVSECQKSSSQAYELFKKLLINLKNQKTQDQAQHYLKQLKEFCLNKNQTGNNFQFLQQRILNHKDESIDLDLLQFPSTFLPEAWSFTFYEGLIRYPSNEYNNKKVIELGCGIGWITIALAMRYPANKIYGLDINPKAITCAELNIYLNAFNEKGELKTFKNGRSLIDIVEFHESNLFSSFEGQDLSVDRIIGCIPQVLNPEPEQMESLIAETSTDEYLQSLSNYFVKQGFIEDQFGLGLIASAVEQSIPLLEESGKLILNLGGRPGRSVLERLMKRRGFKVRRIWQTQVEQAADTEIDTLVDIEKNTGHRFEFYMSANSDTSIDARTAQNYANAGGKIYHSVDVYEAQMLFPEQVKAIFKSVDEIASKELRSAIDLTYDNFQDAEERYSFLAFLAKHIQTTENFPYQTTAGLNYFREQLTEYFRYYYFLKINKEQIIINPGRKELINNLLMSYKPNRTLVANSLYHLVNKDLDHEDHQILQIPSRVELLVKLVKQLKPQLIITHLDKHEIQSSQMVEQLITIASQSNATLVIDLTENIDLSSKPNINGVYRYFANRNLPKHVILMAGLMNNRVYQNYSLNITITSNQMIAEDLINAAELTYSRTSTLKQFYYAHLLEQLLYFQRTRTTDLLEETEKEQVSNYESLKLCKKARSAFNHPAITGNLLDFNQSTIRMDYGENELATPFLLKRALFESYLLRDCDDENYNPHQEIMELVHQRFKFPLNIQSQLVFSNGVAALYSALLNLCLRAQKKLLIPSGSYGYFVAAAEYKGLDYEIINTQEQNGFKLTANDLHGYLSKNKGGFLFLNAPVINPTGAVYHSEELAELLDIAAEYETTVIMDCIFNGLEFDSSINWNLAHTVLNKYTNSNSHLIMMNGVSKEHAAGGLRFAYACSSSLPLIKELQEEMSHSPHLTIRYAVKKLLQAQLSKEPSLSLHLETQRNELACRAQRLTNVLEHQGWQVIHPEGGLFMVAKPQRLIEKMQLSEIEAGDLVTKKLFEQQNVVINNSTWTGLPGYCRFVLSCSKETFEEALSRLKNFQIV